MRPVARRPLLVVSLAVTVIATASCSGGGGDNPPPPPTHRISGTVSGAIQAGVTMSLTGASTATTTTDASGNYSFSSLADGAYTVTPSRAGFTFSPASLAVTLAGADVTGRNFTATAVPPTTHAISGTVSGAVQGGVTVTLSGAASATTTTDGSGNYAFTNLADGAYTVTPSRAGFTFSPASLAVTLAGADATGRNFTATAAPTHAISGTVSGAVQGGVIVTLGGAAITTTTTDASGNYSFTQLADGAYTVTPSRGGYTFTPPSLLVTLAGADATGRDFLAIAGGCPEPNHDVDRSGFSLYDTLCGPALDGSRWQIPGSFQRQVSGGAAWMRVAVANEEPRQLRNSIYNSFAALASPGQRVTTLRSDVAVAAATASRSGEADIRASVRLIYQPPSGRLLFPGAYADLMAFEVGLLDEGAGLFAYRQLVHCDNASCSTVSDTGIDFVDPTGFVPLELGLQAGTPAAYDTGYTAQVSLDEATGVFSWTISGGAFGAGGISGTADPSAYLASAAGWSGIPLAGAGFFAAQIGVSSRDNFPTGGGQADVTGQFDNVWAGFNDTAPAPWDDFGGTGTNSGPGGFLVSKWGAWGNASALPSSGSFVHHIDLVEPPGGAGSFFSTIATNVAFPADLDAMQVDVVVPSSPIGGSSSVFLQGRFYNDGTAGGAPNSAIGDVQGQIRIYPLAPVVDNASFLIFKCTTANCSTTTPLGSGTFGVGNGLDTVHTLRLGFDPTTRVFAFGVDSVTILVDPQVAGPYVTTPAPYVSPAHAPFRILATTAGVSPTATTGSIDARFNHVYTWSASAPACNTLVNSGPTVQWMNVAQDPPAPTGGAIAQGTYRLTAANFYTGPGGASGPAGFSSQETLLVTPDTVQIVSLVSGEPERRTTVEYVVSGTHIDATVVCGDAGSASVGFTVSGNDLILYFPDLGGTDEQVYTLQ